MLYVCIYYNYIKFKRVLRSILDPNIRMINLLIRTQYFRNWPIKNENKYTYFTYYIKICICFKNNNDIFKFITIKIWFLKIIGIYFDPDIVNQNKFFLLQTLYY